MELMLAIVVGTAVIFFGALISLGNERQRKAIDHLREQAMLWAIQDLHMKREKLARDVRVEDPLRWFSKIAAKTSGQNLNLQFVEAFENPQVLVCADERSGRKIIFTLQSPAGISDIKRAKHSPLSRYADGNPLLSLPRGVRTFECSVLNSGILFDLELPIAWKGLTRNPLNETGFMWIYILA